MDTFEHLAIASVDLIEALETRMDEGFWVIDLETGEVILAGLEGMAEQDGEEPPDYEDSDRYLDIQPIPSRDAYQIMEDFVEGLPAGEEQRSLERALGHSRPFRSFKDTLLDFPPIRERWFKFQHARMLEEAQAWLEENLPGARLNPS